MLIFNYSKLIDPLLKDVRVFTLEFAEIKKGDRVLDICCGTGDQAFYYVKKGAIVTGIDLSPKMIEVALNRKQKQGVSDIYFKVADAATLPFEDNIFDIASISLALHEIESSKRDAVISEMKRVVKKDGRLIFIDFKVPFVSNTASYLIKAAEYLAGKNNRASLKSYIEEGGLPILLGRNKLKLEKIVYFKDGLLTIIKTKNI
jgi:ubiquinone/menaquinone biosynthesis C-methylase UbiE